jgi:16S rRNA (uracil1498-N3)-methyltransferase
MYSKSSSFEKSSFKYHLHLAVAPTKMNDRYEWFQRKQLNLPWNHTYYMWPSGTKNSQYRKTDKIILSAMKQFQWWALSSKVEWSSFFKRFLKTWWFTTNAHCEETDKKTLKSVLKPNENITLLRSWRRFFSKKKLPLAPENNYAAVSLGNTRLRNGNCCNSCLSGSGARKRTKTPTTCHGMATG